MNKLNTNQIEALSAMSGVEADVLRRMQHQNGIGDSEFFGHPWGVSLTSGRSRFCVECYVKDGFHNRIFDLHYLTVCPKHRRLIWDRCPRCRTPLMWGRKAFGICAKGCLVPIGRDADAYIEGDLLVEKMIFERCGQAHFGIRPVARLLHADFRDQPLERQLALFNFLGRFDEIDAKSKTRLRKVPTSSEQLNRGFAIAADWPDSFEAWLEKQYEPTRKGPSNLNGSMHRLRRMLLASALGEAAKLVRDAIARFALSRRINSPFAVRWLYLGPGEGELVPITRAINEMNAALLRGQELPIADQLAVPKEWDPENVVTLGRGEADWRSMGDTLSITAVRKALGLDHRAVAHLVDIGLLSTTPRSNTRGIEVRPQIRIEKRSVMALVEGLGKSISNAQPPKNFVSLRKFRKGNRVSGMNFGITLKAVLLGVLPAGGWRQDMSPRDIKVAPECLKTIFGSNSILEQIRGASIPGFEGARGSGRKVVLTELGKAQDRLGRGSALKTRVRRHRSTSRMLKVRIYEAVEAGRLHEPFSPAEVHAACPGWSDDTYGVFLAQHRLGNPSAFPELFENPSRGRYRISPKLKQTRMRLARRKKKPAPRNRHL